MEKISQIYDKILKRIITLSSPAVVRFINTVFNKDFDLKSDVKYNWTESIDDKLGKTIADTIITINGVFKFHIEVEISNDNSIAVRMIEYGFREAVKYSKLEDNKVVLNLPEARIIYLEHTKSTPDFVYIVFNFQDQGLCEYKIKTEKLLSYSVEELNESGMIILMPLYLLKLRKKIARYYETKSLELALELKALVESCILSIETNKDHGNITFADADTLINLLSILFRHLYADYEIFKTEGVDAMIADRLVTYSEQVSEQKAAERVRENAMEIARKMLNLGDSEEKVVAVTGLTREEVESLCMRI